MNQNRHALEQRIKEQVQKNKAVGKGVIAMGMADCTDGSFGSADDVLVCAGRRMYEDKAALKRC